MFRLLLYLRGNDRIWLQNFSLVLDVCWRRSQWHCASFQNDGPMSSETRDLVVATLLIGPPCMLAIIAAALGLRWFWMQRHWRPPGS